MLGNIRIAAVLLSAVSLMFASAAAQSTQAGEPQPRAQIANNDTGFELQLKDPSRRALTGAQVTLVEESGKKNKIKGKTDGKGRFRRTRLLEGKYLVTIERPGFVAYTGTVTVQENKITTLDVELKIHASAEISWLIPEPPIARF